MVLAIEQCHRLGFIHRDIKPDVSVMMVFPHFPPVPGVFRWRRLLTFVNPTEFLV